jgi:hypothetical protein
MVFSWFEPSHTEQEVLQVIFGLDKPHCFVPVIGPEPLEIDTGRYQVDRMRRHAVFGDDHFTAEI